MLELLAIRYSPWSEKARWAMDHYGVTYKETRYNSMTGELGLRKRLGRWRGKITVPILFAEGDIIDDSLEIAKYLETDHGQERPLFPQADCEEIDLWNSRSEAGLAAGRALASQRVLESPGARREAMPPMPKFLVGPLTAPLTRFGIAYLRRKYNFGDDTEGQTRTYTEMLTQLQDVLSDGRPFILGDRFSYADICMAVSLQFVRPVTDEYIKLGPASRKTWGNEELAQEYDQLLRWRDQIYQSHRRS